METDPEHPAVGDVREATEASVPFRLYTGATLPVRAARFLAGRVSLWPHVVVPALITAVLFAYAVYAVVFRADALIASLWARPPVEQWWDWLVLTGWYGAVVVAGALLMAACYIAVLLVGGLIAAPFNDFLSDRAESHLLPDDAVPSSEASLVDGTLRALISTVSVLGAYAVTMVPILALNLIPGLGSILSTALGTIAGAGFLALEYCSGPLERRELRLGQRIRLLRRHAALAFGFGLGTAAFLWIPLVNFLTIPVAVVAGVMLSAGIADDPEGA